MAQFKGKIQDNPLPQNWFVFDVKGLPPLTIISMDDPEQELENIELPDRTIASSGIRSTFSMNVVTPEHHVVQQAAWEGWWNDSQFPVDPDYKKNVTVQKIANDGTPKKFYFFRGVFPTTRNPTGVNLEADGEEGRVTWGLSVDDMFTLAGTIAGAL